MTLLILVALLVAAYIAGFGDGRQYTWLARFRRYRDKPPHD